MFKLSKANVWINPRYVVRIDVEESHRGLSVGIMTTAGDDTNRQRVPMDADELDELIAAVGQANSEAA
jgi:hypothetical protein